MASSVSVDTGATTRVAASLQGVADRLADPSGLLTDITARVAADAGSRTPRATGALAASLVADRATLDGHPAVTLTWGARYAAYVNFGTRTTRAQPFATDALTRAAGDADRILTTWAQNIVDGVS